MEKNKKKPYPVTPEMAKQILQHSPFEKLGVPLSERDGVYVHSFICNNCGLHFNVYSWKADKHTTSNVFCPECGKTGNFRHWRKVINEHQHFTFGADEIDRHVPVHNSEVMSDTSMRRAKE